MEKSGNNNKMPNIKEIKSLDKSYTAMTKNESASPINLKKIIKSASDDQRIEEHQKKVRAKNLIIHGYQEKDGIDSNVSLIESIMKDLKVKVNKTHSSPR